VIGTTPKGNSIVTCEGCGKTDEVFETECVSIDYEWMSCDPRCAKCKTEICQHCAHMCTECANIGEDPEAYAGYCKDCAPPLRDVCEDSHHRWWVCGKHPEVTRCGECKANQNYSARHSVF
jgi:hypothetical protein